MTPLTVLARAAFLTLTFSIAFAGSALAGPPSFTGPAASPPSFTAPAATPPAAFGRPVAAPLQSSSPLGAIFAWVVDTQQTMQRELVTAVEDLKTRNAFAAGLTLASLSFVYGVVHAVGPGHGKTIISSYVVANEETARRGIMISFLAAVVQAISAIVLVTVLAVILNATGIQLRAWSDKLESASYAMIAVVGLWLLFGQLKRLWAWGLERRDHMRASTHMAPAMATGSLAFAHAEPHGHAHQHDHSHDHFEAHAHACCSHGHEDRHDHEHHAHEGEACGHIVDPRALAGPVTYRKLAAVVLSVGVRPCTGAIVVLVFALAQGLFWAGIAATFAMALGTAVTVAILATLALGSRELALKLGGSSGGWASGVWNICAMGGSLIIVVFGVSLFFASLGPARPF